MDRDGLNYAAKYVSGSQPQLLPLLIHPPHHHHLGHHHHHHLGHHNQSMMYLNILVQNFHYFGVFVTKMQDFGI